MDRGRLFGIAGFVLGAASAVWVSTVVVTAATSRVSGDPTPLDLTAATSPVSPAATPSEDVTAAASPSPAATPSEAASPTSAPTAAATPSTAATSVPDPAPTSSPDDDPTDDPTPTSSPSDDPTDDPTDEATVRPSPSPSPSASDRPADDRLDERRTATAVGGTARFHYTSRGIEVEFATPNQGFRVEVKRDGPFDVRVLFESPDHVSRIDAELEDGHPRIRVREESRD